MNSFLRTLVPGLCAAAFAFAAADAVAQKTVLHKQDKGTRRYVPISAQSASTIDASEAAFRLERARSERAEGVQPLPNELGTTKDARQRYWQRQEKLRLEVEQAQRRANQTVRSNEAAGRATELAGRTTRVAVKTAQPPQAVPAAAPEELTLSAGLRDAAAE